MSSKSIRSLWWLVAFAFVPSLMSSAAVLKPVAPGQLRILQKAVGAPKLQRYQDCGKKNRSRPRAVRSPKDRAAVPRPQPAAAYSLSVSSALQLTRRSQSPRRSFTRSRSRSPRRSFTCSRSQSPRLRSFTRRDHAMTNEGASDKFDVVAIVASSRIVESSSTYNFLKDQLSPFHTSRDAVIILDCWRDGWGYGTARSVRKIENYVRSLRFGAGALRMVYDPRCPRIHNLSAAEVKNAGFVLIVGGNGQALLQAAFSEAGGQCRSSHCCGTPRSCCRSRPATVSRCAARPSRLFAKQICTDRAQARGPLSKTISCHSRSCEQRTTSQRMTLNARVQRPTVITNFAARVPLGSNCHN